MKNQIVKKLLAGSMAVVVGAGCAGAYGYSRMPEMAVCAQEEDKEELQEKAEEVLSDRGEEKTNGFYKEESVYVKTDAAGKKEETIVTEWLKNTGNGEVQDQSELDGIENVKGEEEFTKGKDGELTWKSQGEDIYYQGTTDKELPVEVRISYKLDGKDISPEDLKGKDGKVEIHIAYVNKSKETVTVNEEEAEMYTPFTMVSALMLPVEEYKNVQVDNGQVLSDADKDIVVGMAFPGLKENLKLEELDVEIPESVTITADVKNASVGPVMTVASANVIDKLGLDEVSSFGDLEDSVGELSDAAAQLVDGTKEAADGSKTLSDGVNTLNSKGSELISGVNSLAAGVSQYTNGVNSVSNGTAALAEGAAGVAGGAKELQAGIGELQAGATKLQAGETQLKPLIDQCVSMLQAQGIAENASLDSADAQLDAALQALDSEPGTIVADAVPTVSADTIVANAMASLPEEQQTEEVRNAIAAAVQMANDSQQGIVTYAESPAQETAAYIQGAKQELASAKEQTQAKPSELLQGGFNSLVTGTDELAAGINALAAGSAELVSGTETLAGGAKSAADGAAVLNVSSSTLTAGMTALQQGGVQLTAGTSQLADGANTLAAGNQALADGMSEFKTSGIDKLTEIFNGDIKNVTARIDAMSGLGKDYASFAGIKDGTPGSTKFIIETKGVE